MVVYLARAKTDRLLDEMMTELHTVETLNWLIERTETPPFYRLTSMRKASSHSDPGQPETSRESTTERGTIHTKGIAAKILQKERKFGGKGEEGSNSI